MPLSKSIRLCVADALLLLIEDMITCHVFFRAVGSMGALAMASENNSIVDAGEGGITQPS